MEEDPVLLINTDSIASLFGIESNALADFVAPLVDLDGFKPSGLAVHPITGDLYVVSSVLKVIVVLDRSGRVRSASALDKKLLEQPEGLAFLPNGDLFVSSEGGKRKARLVRYNYR
jgi:uncharacterized protein YjiK